MKKYISLFCILSILTAVFINPTVAATGMQGYAAYRDGVGGNYEWHTGIMDKATSSSVYPIIHTPGSGNVRYAHWYEFMDGTQSNPYANNGFMGYYRPKSQTLTSAKRDAVTATARSLAADFIGYSALHQVNYPVYINPNNKTVVEISDISGMRCDGVVEYCYEFNNIKIYGDISDWNVSKWGIDYMGRHSYLNITPMEQAQDCMTLVAANP